jgi:hypothetical protein
MRQCFVFAKKISLMVSPYPLAVLFCVTESTVGFQTPGMRLYLKVKGIQKAGPLFDAIKTAIDEHAGAQAAKMIVAAGAFEVTDIRRRHGSLPSGNLKTKNY